MKPLKDLIVSRKELLDWERNLAWGRDGTLYLTSFPDICVAQPVYSKDVASNSKNLFHIKDYPLDYGNKFEFESAGINSLLNSQPVSFGKLIKPSPTSNLLAVLTNNLNVIVFKEQEKCANLDEKEKELEERAYHSVEWAPDGSCIAVGNERRSIVIFTITQNDEGKVESTVKANIELDTSSSKGWVTNIYWKNDVIAACLDDNSVFLVHCNQNYSAHQASPPSRFKIIDLCILNSSLLTTDPFQLRKVDLISGKNSAIPLGSGDAFYIVPLSEASQTVVLMSNKTTCKVTLGEKLTLLPDDIISPILERKFKKWSSLSNEFNMYETTMLLHGVSLAPDGYSVALIYSLERVSLKYKIASECLYHIAFIPLSELWKISKNATGLAWYQTYQIYKCTMPLMEEEADRNNETQGQYHVEMSLKEYVKAFMNDGEMNNLRFFNFIEPVPSIQLFRRAIFEYAVANSTKITNLLDKASIQSLAAMLDLESPTESEIVEIKSDLISETFDFKRNVNADVVISEQGHAWKRCAVTLLPILTTRVKICPISKQRVIDIRRDNFNDYGWFTRTLLEVLNDESVYSGTSMIAVEN